MFLDLFNRKEKCKFVVIDSIFPQKEPMAFRNSEINEYFKKIKHFTSYTMFPMRPDSKAWFSHGYGIDNNLFEENKTGYLKKYPQNKNRIKHLDKNKKYEFELAYSYFLAETYTCLPFYEENSIPFVFVLYPGGGFGINFDKSDSMLSAIFNSRQFRGVIVTQQITRDYLLEKGLCPKDKIYYIYGGFVQFRQEEVRRKKQYIVDKQTFDICFVANKYSSKGVDKGYDLFIDVAKSICMKTRDIMFHVVGNISIDEINIDDIKSRVVFHGIKMPDSLVDFYSGMDIFLSPNRPHELYNGNFDGFPLGIDSLYCGVAGFVADELKMNSHYINGENIEIIPLDSKRISAKILDYYNDPKKLYLLSNKGKEITQKLFDIDYQINERIKVFQKFVDIKIK